MTDTYIPIPWTPGSPQPRISDGVYRAIRSDGNGGFEGVPNAPTACRLTLRRAADGAISGTLSCGEVSVDITRWTKVADMAFEFQADGSWEAFVRRLCERVKA